VPSDTRKRRAGEGREGEGWASGEHEKTEFVHIIQRAAQESVRFRLQYHVKGTTGGWGVQGPFKQDERRKRDQGQKICRRFRRQVVKVCSKKRKKNNTTGNRRKRETNKKGLVCKGAMLENPATGKEKRSKEVTVRKKIS